MGLAAAALGLAAVFFFFFSPSALGLVVLAAGFCSRRATRG